MATKSKKDGGQRYDWDLIMNDYVCNRGMSLRKIEKKYGIPHFTISKKSKADNWFAAKQEYQKQVQIEVRTEVRTKTVEDLVGLVRISDIVEKTIIQAIENDPEYFYKHLINDNLSEKREILDILNTKAMKDLMRVVKDVEDVKRSLQGIKREDQIIAAERLQLERERFEFEKQKTELFKPTEGNVIRIEGFEKGWSE